MISEEKRMHPTYVGRRAQHHLGYSPGANKSGGTANHRNGANSKNVLTDDEPLRITFRAAGLTVSSLR